MSAKILCDFDGTITHRDVTDGLLERFALPEWRLVEEDYLGGRIGSRECMLRQVDLIRADPSEIDRFLDQEEIDPFFPEFVQFCKDTGLQLQIVSDGMDYAIKRILGRHGLDHLPIVTNHLEILGNRRFRLQFPHANDGCSRGSGTCKCAMAKPAQQALPWLFQHPEEDGGAWRTILIGDGTSDYCVASTVDLVFAKNKLLEYCRRTDVCYRVYRDFADICSMMEGMYKIGRMPIPDHFKSDESASTWEDFF
ncbi:MAG: MtnX-like HAD-IB family phosphatase [Magnetococcales bacterium]|nr:MtnX-like HAD-IB family phosphatase [Magnetococcales bacterium]